MNTADEIRAIIEGCQSSLEASVVAALMPAKDEISASQAYKEFGVLWVKNQVERGKITGTRLGPSKNSKIIYSRKQLICLRDSEKMAATLCLR